MTDPDAPRDPNSNPDASRDAVPDDARELSPDAAHPAPDAPDEPAAGANEPPAGADEPPHASDEPPAGTDEAPAGAAPDLVSEIRRAARLNLRWSMILAIPGVVLGVLLLALSLQELSWRTAFAVLVLGLFLLRLRQIQQLRPIANVTGLREGRLESADRAGFVVAADDGTRLLLKVMRPRGSAGVKPGDRVRVTEPFEAGKPVALLLPGPEHVEGLLALPTGPARAAAPA